MTTKIFAYDNHSKSARLLAEEMDVSLLRHNNSRYVPRAGDTIINWGSGRVFPRVRILNHPFNVAIAVNKLRFFRHMDAAPTPPRIPTWTVDRRTAQVWAADGGKVVARTVLTGKEGQGITIARTPNEVPVAPLYTRYVPKHAEYRIHMVGNRIIDEQQKVLRRTVDHTQAQWEVRNTANGFVFQRQNINVPEDVRRQALLSLQACGLEFAAADVIWNERRQQAYVLELNTAPGIEGTTVLNYARALTALANQR
jgi:glutathione synthase/RimK-type ligase-like ATP-grasp enzyme